MRFVVRLVATLHLLAATFVSSAQSLPSGLFSVGPFEIGKSTVDDIQSRFGINPPTPIESGDGADLALCYSTSAAPSAPTIVFETGALGGWKEITAFRLTKRGRRQCLVIDAPLTDLSTANGLGFRSKRESVQRALNQSMTRTSTTSIQIEEVYRRRPTQDEASRMRHFGSNPDQIEFDVIDTVEVRFRRDVVEELYVKRLVSY